MAHAFRKQVGPEQRYKGRTIRIDALCPDVLAVVDGQPLPNPWLTAEAARKGAMKYIDDVEREAAKHMP